MTTMTTDLQRVEYEQARLAMDVLAELIAGSVVDGLEVSDYTVSKYRAARDRLTTARSVYVNGDA